jgi:hypothetical protein
MGQYDSKNLFRSNHRSSPHRLTRTTTSSPKQSSRRKKYASLSSAVPRLWMHEQVIGSAGTR